MTHAADLPAPAHRSPAHPVDGAPIPPAKAVVAPRRWSGLAGCERLLGLVFCGVVMLNFASAAGRYLGGHALIGADEVQVYTMVWLIFMGAALAAVRGIHLRMDVLSMRLSSPHAAWRQRAEDLLTLLVCGVMAWVSFDFMRQIYAMEQRSDAAGIPMWIPHLSAGIGFSVIALHAAWLLAAGPRRNMP